MSWLQKRRARRNWRKAQRDIARHDAQFERDHPNWQQKYGGRRAS